MTALLLVFAALFGLVIGSFLNVVAYRVPAHVSLMRESRCPHCDAPIRWYQNIPVFSWLFLRGRCAECKAPISVRYPIVEAITSAAFVIVTWWVLAIAGSPVYVAVTSPDFWVVLVAYLYFASISIVLTLIDIDVHRLPNGIVLPSYAVGIILFALACLLGAPWSKLLSAAIGMAVLYLFYFLIRFISPRGMGGGDVKLAGVVGLFLGWGGWPTLIVGAFAAWVLAGLFSLVLIAVRRAGRKTAIPFGPWMLLGAWVGLFVGGRVGHWYLGLYT
ncbi:peptidase A24 [Microbacterium mangrovi]|uniref:Peptidase A24 n=1 Tax=Microbacterium mangrovi TaxID=1348253 RepID=A0A0B2AC27_9MICO|nr:A24 family peptidase [Microbacterium mangrovi]KHK99186.1 peptidase A24 [Microbacterium mangrovi]